MTNDSMKTPSDGANVTIGDQLIADMNGEQKTANIIARLPYEVQVSILERVASTRLLLRLLECSQGWKKVVEDNSKFWRKLTILENDQLPREDLQRIFGPSISRHITDLNLFVDSPCYGLLLDTMAAGNFSHLQRLTVEGSTFGNHDQLVNINGNHDQLLLGLRGVADTLVELTITTEASETNDFIPFANILATCRHLESFAYQYCRQPRINLWLGGHALQEIAPVSLIGRWEEIPPNAPLKHFELIVNDMPLTPHMEQFFERCTNLVSIELATGDMPLVAVIHEHCKKLQHLGIRDAFVYEAVIDHDNDAYWTWKLKSFHTDNCTWVADYFVPHFRRSALTLESLGFEGGALENTQAWNALKTINLPNVRDLSFAIFVDVPLLRQCSASLDALTCRCCDLNDSELLDYIAHLPSLKKLELYDLEQQEDLEDVLRNMFLRLTNRSSADPMTVILQNSADHSIDYDAILSATPYINNLRNIGQRSNGDSNETTFLTSPTA